MSGELGLRKLKIRVTEEQLKHGHVFYDNTANKNSYLASRCEENSAKAINDHIDAERKRIEHAINHQEQKFLHRQFNRKCIQSPDEKNILKNKAGKKNIDNNVENCAHNEEHTYGRSSAVRKRKTGIMGAPDWIQKDIELNQIDLELNSTPRSCAHSSRMPKRKISLSCNDLLNIEGMDSDFGGVEQRNNVFTRQTAANPKCETNIPSIVLQNTESTDVSVDDYDDWRSDVTDDEIAIVCNMQSDNSLEPRHRKISLSHNDIHVYEEKCNETLQHPRHSHEDVMSYKEAKDREAYTTLKDKFRQIRLTIQAERGCSVSSSPACSVTNSPRSPRRDGTNGNYGNHGNRRLPPLDTSRLSTKSNCSGMNLSKSLDLPRGTFLSVATSDVSNSSSSSTEGSPRNHKHKRNQVYRSLLTETEKMLLDKKAQQRALLAQHHATPTADPVTDPRFTQLIQLL